ncbi:PD-(D/E)XK nuclease domain-containing protein [Bradyrhizobium japonicum]|uniref:PD-(D/E)XK nuclease domain-containing protein n=1 Tax=Bradyrhizobium japonicum TaxID=375 RepID=UPI001BA8CDB9|nr:hypothetical protein [Bradyrhizobium japonicum]MBR0910169.1 hypothetical protein [Bradyrhizobium japonicum]
MPATNENGLAEKLLKAPPANYWHCAARKPGEKRYSKSLDLTFDQVIKNVVEPWLEGRSFTVGPLILRSSDDASEILICHTGRSAAELSREWYATHQKDYRRYTFDTTNLPFRSGTHVAQELLFQPGARRPFAADVGLVLRLCERLPKAAQVLAHRSHKEKTPYVISDEYDVQDLLQGLLRGYLEYSVQEDMLPKIAGVRSSRVDVSIEELGVLIEVKYAREAADQKRFLKELSEDLMQYAKWPHLKTLIFLVYNAKVFRDGEALKKEAAEMVIDGRKFRLEIVLA